MKTKQCHHFIVLIGLLIGCLLPATVGASVKVGNFYYNLNASDFTAEFTHRPDDNGHYTEAVISIPASINYGDNTYRVTSIGDYAFTYEDLPVDNRFNDHLTTVEIPNSVIKIGKGIFLGCSSLASIIVESGNTTFDSRNNCNAIIETATNTLLAGCPNTIIPNSVTSIGDEAFAYCWGLTEIDIPNSVTRIGNDAFYECGGLTSLTIPGSVNEIGRYAFYACYSLNSLTIMDGVSIIRECAFFTASDYLTSIIIPPSVQTIFLDSFEIGRYTSVTVEWTEPVIPQKPSYYDEDWENKSFCWGASGCTLHVPNGTVEAYRNADFWSEFENIEELTLNVDGIYYNISPSTMTASVTKKPSGYYSGDITIPETVSLDDKTYRVTEIEELAFYDCKSLTSVTIPNGVTSIGYQAFYNCTRLTSIDIPNSVTNIGRGAFSNCTGLTSVTIPNGVTSIEPETFNMCNSLASVIIPNGVTSIGSMAFCRCFDLTSVTIPNGVTSIGYEAFLYCTGLTSVTIPNSVTSISNEAFSNCTSLTSFTCQIETPVTITNSVFSGVNKSTCTLNVPTGSKSAYQSADVWKDFSNIVEQDASVLATGPWGDNVTYTIYSDMSMVISGTGPMWDENSIPSNYMSSIESVTIEEGVTTIGKRAFRSYSNLTSVTIPSSITDIGKYAFENCTSLNSVTIPYGVATIDAWAFNNCYSLASVTIPNSVTTIAVEVFGNCTNLTSVTIPSSVTIVAGSVFSGCTALSSIIVDADNAIFDSRNNCNAIIETSTNKLIVGCKNTVIPSSVTSIGEDAFENCTGLTSMTIPNSVTEIGVNAFMGCSGLTSVTIPSSVTDISGGAFKNCTGLTSITCESETPVGLYEDVFDGVNKSSCTLYVPAGSKSAYENAEYWNLFTHIVEQDASVLATGPCGDNLTYTIYDDMSMVITGTGPMWDYMAEDTHPNQDYYSDVKSVTIEDGCTYVGKYAFDLMGSLTDVTIPGSVIEIGTGAFSYCRQLSSLELSAGLKIIGGGAFECCGRQNSGLKSITIPSTVTTIGGAAFTSCYLNSIKMESSTPLTIYSNTFASTDVNSCTLYVPTGSKSAYQSADVWKDFTNIVEYEGASPSVLATGPCGDNLTYTIYDDLSMVITGTGPMWDYSSDTPMNSDYKGSVTSVTIEEGCTAIGKYAFYGCAGLTSVDIPNSVTSIGENAFWCCTGLTSVDIPNSVTSIGWNAFANTGLTTVTIPSSVSYISPATFTYCSGLIFINVEAGNATYDSRENCNAIIEKSTNTLIAGCNNTVIPNSVTSIDIYALAGCTGLTSIDIPNSVTSIGEDAFESCTGLTSVDIPNSVTSIGNSAFLVCTGLSSVDIPSSVTSIGDLAFADCTSLSSISVGMTTPIAIPDLVFYGVNKSTCTLYVPTGCKTAYQEAEVWSEFENIVEVEDYVMGDANGDGMIRIGDASAILHYIVGNPSAGFNAKAADVNGDGLIRIGDVSAVLKIIVGL